MSTATAKKTKTQKKTEEKKTTQKIDTTQKVDYSQLLKEALTGEGKLLEAYSMFHNFSFCNTILAMIQLEEIAPIKTYNQWLAMGRKVKAGSKAVSLWMPMICHKKNKETGEYDGDEYMRFKFVNRWFGLYQTEVIEGQNDLFKPELNMPAYNIKTAMKELGIKEVKFAKVNGNVQGYASENKIAINPVAQLPDKTRFHEMAHIVLEHTKDTKEILIDNEKLTKEIKEVEAEAVAMLCLASLNLEGIEYCRGYIQSWYKGKTEIPEESCKRIISATNKILKAGMPKKEYDKENK